MHSGPEPHSAQNERHETRDNAPRRGGQAAQISLNDEKYCTRWEARIGWVEVIVTGPPIVPAGKVTYASPPAATVAVCDGTPGTLTVTSALVPPGLSRWMLSLNIPGDALSNQVT